MKNKKVFFSKSYKNILEIKSDFYINNKKNIKKIKKLNLFYKKQKIRKVCKTCGLKIKNFYFKSHNIKYGLCKKCGHFNGQHEDSIIYNNFIYNSDKGKNYSANYSKNFDLRVKNIYLPKVKFLQSVIKQKLKIFDLGCGGGHFLKALEISGINGRGYDTSENLIFQAKKKLKKNTVKHLELKESINELLLSDCNTLSLIGVLEHLTNPRDIFVKFKESKLKYFYLSLPLLSLSTLLEKTFQNVFPRQLSGGHTHLYTKESINYLAKKYNLKVIGEWWFGTDIADLYRSMIISNKKNNPVFNNLLDKYLYTSLDGMQNSLDKEKICSEVHIILKK